MTRFITANTRNGDVSINRIATAVTECRFEATDHSSYEVTRALALCMS